MLWIIERLLDDDVLCALFAGFQIAGVLLLWAEATRRRTSATFREFWLPFTLPKKQREYITVRSVGRFTVSPARWEMSPSERALCPPAIPFHAIRHDVHVPSLAVWEDSPGSAGLQSIAVDQDAIGTVR